MIQVRATIYFEDALAMTSKEAVEHFKNRINAHDGGLYMQGCYEVNMMNNTGWKYYIAEKEIDK